MKKIYYLLLLTLPFLFQSCLKEEEDIFGKDPSVRVEEALKNYKKVLASAENGWLLEYYAETNQVYGGYNFAMKFSNSDVTAYFELADPTTSMTSLYQLISDDGPVLSFDTYNPFLHFFADPSSDMPDAYEGDYEFILMGISEDGSTINLKGKKTGNRMVMKQLAESPDTYLSKVGNIEKACIAPAYSMTVNNKIIDCSINNHQLVYQYADESDAIESGKVAFCYTSTGIRLYEATEIAGKTVQVFTLENQQLVSEDGNIVISLIFPPANETLAAMLSPTSSHILGLNFDYLKDTYNMSDAVKGWLQNACSQNLENMGELLVELYFRAYEGKSCFCYYSNDGEKNWAVMYNYEHKAVSGTENKVVFSPQCEEGLNAEYYPHLKPFVNKVLAEGTYLVTANDKSNPTEFRLTSEKEPNIWFDVYVLK